MSTEPGYYPIKLYQGDAWSLVVTYLDSDDNPVDLSGYGARMQIRERVDLDDALLTLTSDDSQISIDTVNAVITASVTEDESETLPTDNRDITQSQGWVYSLRIFEIGNENSTALTLLYGPVSVIANPTRDRA